MRRVIKPKILYRYVGDESPEEKENALDEIFFPIFARIAMELKDKKTNKSKK